MQGLVNGKSIGLSIHQEGFIAFYFKESLNALFSKQIKSAQIARGIETELWVDGPSGSALQRFFSSPFLSYYSMPKQSALSASALSTADISEVIKLAWEDRTTFETIEERMGVREAQVIKIMRLSLTASSFKMWRARVRGRKTKHRLLRPAQMKFNDRAAADHRRANC